MTNNEIISSLRGLIGKYNLTDEEWQTVEKTIKVLNNSDKDCISRAELLKAIDTWDKFGVDDTNSLFRLDNLSLPHYVSYIHYDDVIKCIKGMPSIQPTAKENLVVGDCISREFIEIVVNYPPADLCTYPEYRGKPYFSIKYRENGNGYVGFGTYKIEMLSQWIKEYFMPSIQPKAKTEWIPISERYPKIEDEYKFFLVTDDKGKVSVQKFLLSLEKEPQPYFSGMVNVIAWMPLPYPYKAESRE